MERIVEVREDPPEELVESSWPAKTDMSGLQQTYEHNSRYFGGRDCWSRGWTVRQSLRKVLKGT